MRFERNFECICTRLFILLSANYKHSLNAFKRNYGGCIFLHFHHAPIQKRVRTPKFATKTRLAASKMRLVITWDVIEDSPNFN